ncbi:isocitrate lyase/phosphoenolpyruvate mutase family protein [Chryseobacterium sp.]|uniref:isocitrate lyase/PEP mutase family protein n=1 Tax=Chryseobacterium sp. TaxID=1871047 RepID=UPI0025BFECC4|nr:isocitrate lyase/phosphoenolpyruvate mutase family protein [Chryseobacterium sp.]
MTDIQRFKRLHVENTPLLLGNVWNVQSAKIYEKAGYKALATSSSAVAESLGYDDGENMSFEEYFHIIKRITESVSIPLTVDLEGGYGNTPDEITTNISRLVSIGVVGVNIEDSVVKNGVRRMLDKGKTYDKLKAVTERLRANKINIFLNIRTDAFLLGLENPLQETCERIRLFENLGVDGVFVPCVTSENDIETLVNLTTLPINVMGIPGLPGFEILKNLGVKRISSGNFVNSYIYRCLEITAVKVVADQNFSTLFI